jgi:hypothetical protein
MLLSPLAILPLIPFAVLARIIANAMILQLPKSCCVANASLLLRLLAMRTLKIPADASHPRLLVALLLLPKQARKKPLPHHPSLKTPAEANDDDVVLMSSMLV